MATSDLTSQLAALKKRYEEISKAGQMTPEQQKSFSSQGDALRAQGANEQEANTLAHGNVYGMETWRANQPAATGAPNPMAGLASAVNAQKAPEGQIGVRSYLEGQGYNVGWKPSGITFSKDGQTGTIDPGAYQIVNDRSYMTPQALADALYAAQPKTTVTMASTGQGQAQPAPAGQVLAQALQPNAPAPTTTTAPSYNITPREPSQEVKDLVAALKAKIDAAPVTAEQIMASPEWQAQNKVLDVAQGDSMAALRRSLASRNMLRSTPAVQALAGEGARYEAARAQALPQLLQAAYARQQGDIANRLGLLNAASGLENTGFNQAATEAGITGYTGAGQPTMARQDMEAGLTGTYMPTAVDSLYDQVLSLKKQAEDEAKTLTDPVQRALRMKMLGDQAAALRSQIAAAGYDPSIVGGDVSYSQAAQKVGDYKNSLLTQTQRTKAAGDKKAAATAGYIGEALAQGSAQAAYDYISAHRNDILADGADIDAIYNAIKYPQGLEKGATTGTTTSTDRAAATFNAKATALAQGDPAKAEEWYNKHVNDLAAEGVDPTDVWNAIKSRWPSYFGTGNTGTGNGLSGELDTLTPGR